MKHLKLPFMKLIVLFHFETVSITTNTFAQLDRNLKSAKTQLLYVEAFRLNHYYVLIRFYSARLKETLCEFTLSSSRAVF